MDLRYKPVSYTHLEEFAHYAKIMAQMGVTILGGCCGTNPNHIKAIKKELAGLRPVERKIEKITAVSSFTDTVVIGSGVCLLYTSTPRK